MSWRTVVIGSRCKLDYRMGYLVVRSTETRRVFLDEVAVLILENSAVSLTGCLVSALVERKIKVIFCDEKRNPTAELMPYYGSHDTSKKIRIQTAWSTWQKEVVWTVVVAQKIQNQAEFLRELGKETEAELLEEYLSELVQNDATNREGHAAKVYFNALFGPSFTRDNASPTNAALNYGYSILLSATNRAISANGYLTQIGIFHDNVFNPYNLSSDLMEPFRVFVDRAVYTLGFSKFESAEKHQLLTFLEQEIEIEGERQVLLNAIRIYVRRVLDAVQTGDVGDIPRPKK